ncbi:MAG TPA: hypothetical protein VN634_14390 [Candidatus Limnocylindrales bacterium]|nr:hypothetical protein [Candidatus Limnocylindrales bacterium]
MKSGNTARGATLALATVLLIAAGSGNSWGAAVNSKLEGNCFKTMTKSISKHIANITKATAACTERLYDNETVSCPDQEMTDAIQKSRDSATKGIAKKCQSSCSGPTALSCIATTVCPPNGSIPELCTGDGEFEYPNMGFPGPLCPSILGHDMFEPEDFSACMVTPDSGAAEVVAEDVVTNLFGTLDGAPALSATATACLESLEKSVPKTITKLAGTLSKCRLSQLTADNATILVNRCATDDEKTADSIASTITKFRDGIASKCTDGDIAELDVCGGGVTTVAGAQDCLSQMVGEASYSIDPPGTRTYAPVSVINAAYPGASLAGCGDNVVNQKANPFALNGEECDGTDDSACPGACLPPGDVFECTCATIARAHGYADGFAADLDNGWSGKSHNNKVTDLAGFVSEVTNCDCDQFDTVDKATCVAGHSTDPVCNVSSETAPRCGRRIGDHTTCDEVGNNDNAHSDADCATCDQFTVNAGDFCTGSMRRCMEGLNDGDRCNDADDCPGGSCSGSGACLGGPTPGIGCTADAGCGAGGACSKLVCINGSNDETVCDNNADCTGGGRCATTTDCSARCYPEGSTDPLQANGTCAKQSDCAEGERCRGICDKSDDCVVLRNGAPLPLSANGTSVCIDSQFFTNITGTRNIITGEHAINYELRSVIFLAGGHELNSRPCPVCGGFCDGDITDTGSQPSSFLCNGTCTTDPALECRFGKNAGNSCTSNTDCLGELCTGKACRFDDDCSTGVCSGADSPECATHGDTHACVLSLQCGGGTKPNQSCRIEAYTDFGTTSSDCPYSGSNISGTGLAISWTPLTSEPVQNEEPGACDAQGFQNYDCNCVRGGGNTRNKPNGCDAACNDPDPAYYGKACEFQTQCIDACVLGTNPGADCTSNADCTGGGTCPGGNHGGGRACDEDSDCNSGNCGHNPRVCGNGSTGSCSIRRCTGGTNAGAICTQDSACFGPGADCPAAASCTVGGAPCSEGLCKPASCITSATCSGGATCDDACPAGLCTPMCVPRGTCNGGDRDGQRCGIDEKCIGGGTCVPDDPEEGACAQGNFYHCDGPGWTFKNCAPGNVNTQKDCATDINGNPANPGAGFCRADILNCFINDGATEGGDIFNGKGDPTNTLSVASFCIPASDNDAVNSTAGLPGPGRIRQPGYVTTNFDHLPLP